MEFSVGEETRVMLELMEQFIQREVIPLEPEFLTRKLGEIEPEIEKLRKKVKQMGLWGPAQPRDYGGMGLSLTDFALVSEVLGKSPLGHYVFGCQAPDAGNIEILHEYGTPEQKKTWLDPLVPGEIRSCFSMTEVELPGSNPVMMDTTAVVQSRRDSLPFMQGASVKSAWARGGGFSHCPGTVGSGENSPHDALAWDLPAIPGSDVQESRDPNDRPWSDAGRSGDHPGVGCRKLRRDRGGSCPDSADGLED